MIKLFSNEVLNVNLTSVVSKDNEIYFKAKDVAEALGYENAKHAIQNHVWKKNKFEWCVIQRKTRGPTQAPYELLEFKQQTLFLTEPGVYQLVSHRRSHLRKVFRIGSSPKFFLR